MLSLVTWNINSVRTRIARILAFIRSHQPDILCLQEIKCQAGEFPAQAFADEGMSHLAVSGQKGWHGVAVVATTPIEEIPPPDLCRHGHARALAVRVRNTEIHCLYIPAGGDIPDPGINDKFAHKLDFLARMETFYAARSKNTPLFLAGDLNIAPEPNDVWSHKHLLGVVSHTPIETEALKRVRDKGGFCDIARHAHGEEEKLASWWSYRARDWEASARGRRLDHIWADRKALQQVETDSFHIYRSERGGEKPSDHVPVGIRFTPGS